MNINACFFVASAALLSAAFAAAASASTSSQKVLSRSQLEDVRNGRCWECKDGGDCVPEAWLCDGEEDCQDGSDEMSVMACPSCMLKDLPGTPKDFFRRCGPAPQCVWEGTICDGFKDCCNGWDEEGCDEEDYYVEIDIYED